MGVESARGFVNADLNGAAHSSLIKHHLVANNVHPLLTRCRTSTLLHTAIVGAWVSPLQPYRRACAIRRFGSRQAVGTPAKTLIGSTFAGEVPSKMALVGTLRRRPRGGPRPLSSSLVRPPTLPLSNRPNGLIAPHQAKASSASA